LKLIFKLISGKECIADSALSFELVRHRKYSERAIVTATIAIKNSMAAIFTARVAVKIAS